MILGADRKRVAALERRVEALEGRYHTLTLDMDGIEILKSTLESALNAHASQTWKHIALPVKAKP